MDRNARQDNVGFRIVFDPRAVAACRIVTEDFCIPELRKRLVPLLGRADQLGYVFGRTEVIFRQDGDGLAVETHPIP